MAFTDAELAYIDITVGAFVRRRQPEPEIQKEIRYEMTIEGHTVTMWVIRPGWLDRSTESRQGVARFRYTRTRDGWALYWMRADMKWHTYPEVPPSRHLAPLVRAVEEDALCCFFG